MTQQPDQPAEPRPDAPGSGFALVAEAAQKSALLWVGPVGGRPVPAWHAWVDGAAYVVGGGGEQPLPTLPHDVEITLRSKETRARLVRVAATAERVTPDDADWGSATEALKGARLNAADTDTLVDRWAAGSVVLRLRPVGALLEGPGSYDAGSGAAQPPGSDAVTPTRRPWHLGGRLGRAVRQARRSNPGPPAPRSR